MRYVEVTIRLVEAWETWSLALPDDVTDDNVAEWVAYNFTQNTSPQEVMVESGWNDYEIIEVGPVTPI